MKKFLVFGAFLFPLLFIFLPTLFQLTIFSLICFGMGYYTCWTSQKEEKQEKGKPTIGERARLATGMSGVRILARIQDFYDFKFSAYLIRFIFFIF